MKINKVKISLYLLVIVFICITMISFKGTFALFENNGTGIVDNDIGNWIIRLSNELITSGQTEEIVIDSFVYEQKNTVTSGYIAPGSSAYFDLVFDATDCDVAVKYDVTIDKEDMDYAENISISVEEVGSNNVVRTGEDTYSGVIDLESIEDNELVTLRVTIDWQDIAAFDEDDSVLGTTPNSKLAVPITVNAIQYLGETLTPYVEPTEPEEPGQGGE